MGGRWIEVERAAEERQIEMGGKKYINYKEKR